MFQGFFLGGFLTNLLLIFSFAVFVLLPTVDLLYRSSLTCVSLPCFSPSGIHKQITMVSWEVKDKKKKCKRSVVLVDAVD